MEDKIHFIYSYFPWELLIIHSMNLGIKYWTIIDAGCVTKSDSSTTAVRVDNTSTPTSWDQVFGRRIE